MKSLTIILAATGVAAGMAYAQAEDTKTATATSATPIVATTTAAVAGTPLNSKPPALSQRQLMMNPMMEMEKKLADLGKQYREATTDEAKAKLKDEIQKAAAETLDKRLEMIKQQMEVMKKASEDITARREEMIKRRVDMLTGATAAAAKPAVAPAGEAPKATPPAPAPAAAN